MEQCSEDHVVSTALILWNALSISLMFPFSFFLLTFLHFYIPKHALTSILYSTGQQLPPVMERGAQQAAQQRYQQQQKNAKNRNAPQQGKRLTLSDVDW